MNSFILLGGGMLVFYFIILWVVSIKPIIENRNEPITEEEIIELKKQRRIPSAGSTHGK